MKTILLIAFYLLVALAPAHAQLGYLMGRVEDKLTDKATRKVHDRLNKRVEEAVERKSESVSTEYYSALLADGRIVCHGIVFEPGTAIITPASRPVVGALARTLVQNPAKQVRIEAHTLSDRNEPKSLALSQQRAEAVRQALIQQGVAANRLTAKGLGSSRPLTTEPEKGLDSLNQRIELVSL